MDLSFVMKLVAKEIGLPASIVDELKGAKVEVVESEGCLVSGTVKRAPGDEWPGVCVRLLVTAQSTGTFPVIISIPNLVMDRLPESVRARICEVAIG